MVYGIWYMVFGINTIIFVVLVIGSIGSRLVLPASTPRSIGSRWYCVAPQYPPVGGIGPLVAPLSIGSRWYCPPPVVPQYW